MADPAGRFVPAAGRAGLTALYDPVVRMTMREDAWRPALARRVLEGEPDGILDVGCGTGTLTVELAREGRGVIGLDGDEAVLDRARAKARDAGVEVDWRVGLAGAIPLPDAAVDRVVCSLLLHHLVPAAKTAALADCRRVLRPGGRLVVADWGRPTDLVMRVAFLGLQLLDGFEGTRDHAAGRLPDTIAAAGFASVRTLNRVRTPWGTLELLEAGR